MPAMTKTPARKTPAEIDSEMASYVQRANEVLSSLKGKGASWSWYSHSFNLFELLVGDYKGEQNILLCLPGCEFLSGPTQWQDQQIEVVFRCDRTKDPCWLFEIRDDRVVFELPAQW